MYITDNQCRIRFVNKSLIILIAHQIIDSVNAHWPLQLMSHMYIWYREFIREIWRPWYRNLTIL